MFGELQSVANLAKYPANNAVDVPPRAPGKTSAEKRLEHFGLLYGACQPMRELFRGLDRLSRSTAPVMILGESGSGKELVATTLHHLSARKERPFIAVNCGAIPENLIESEFVRPRARQLYRRGSNAPRLLRARRRRHAVSG